MASKASDLFKQESNGVLESLKEGIQAVAPGLSLSKILHDVSAELKEQAAQGSHELASALFRGDAFVMYPRTSPDDLPDHGLHGADQQQLEQERGGRDL